MILITALLASAATGSNWLPLNSPSPAVVRGFDAATIRHDGDVVTFDAVFAARDFDSETQRITSERTVVPVRLNCRSWAVTIGAGRVHDGDGRTVRSNDRAEPSGDGDPDQWRQACARGAFGKGTPTVEAFLDQQWPHEAGHDRAW